MKTEFDAWHKIVALLMHEFEITQFEVTEGTLAAFGKSTAGNCQR